MNQMRRPVQERSTSDESWLQPSPGQMLEPDPQAHAEILVLTYGLQTAAWIAETNLATARRSDTPYWSRVLQTVQGLLASQAGS